MVRWVKELELQWDFCLLTRCLMQFRIFSQWLDSSNCTQIIFGTIRKINKLELYLEPQSFRNRCFSTNVPLFSQQKVDITHNATGYFSEAFLPYSDLFVTGYSGELHTFIDWSATCGHPSQQAVIDGRWKQHIHIYDRYQRHWMIVFAEFSREYQSIMEHVYLRTKARVYLQY